MKKAMLFLATLFFAVTVNAATFNLTALNGTIATITDNNTSAVGASGPFALLVPDANRPYRATFDLTTDEDTSARFFTSFTPSADLDIFKIGEDGNWKNATKIDLLNSGGSNSITTTMALLTNSTYRIFLRTFKEGNLTPNYNLSVSEVPVPAALFLFAPALLGFFGLRRKASLAA